MCVRLCVLSVQGVVYIGHPLTSLILTPFSGWLIDHIGWRTMLWFPYPGKPQKKYRNAL